MSQDINLDLENEDGIEGEKERMCCFGRIKEEVPINLELGKEDEIDGGRSGICCFERRKVEVSKKNEEKVEDVDQVINELKTYSSLNPWNWRTFVVNLITSGLGSWDVISDEMVGVQFLTSQEPVFGILTILLTFLPGLRFYGYKKKMSGKKYSIAWFFACLFFPLTFLISKVGLLYDQGPRMKNLSMYIASSEASTEAVLQLTLQVFIVLQGNTKASTMQIISIFTSTISISLVATEQLLLLTRNMKVLLQMSVVSYEDLELKEKWVSIGKLLPFFLMLSIFRVTSLSMVTVLLGFYAPVMYTFLLLLLCSIEGIIGGRTKGVSICSFWREWMAQEGALSIISHTLTSVTSLVNDDTLPEITRQVFWFVVNLTLVSGLSLPIYLDHFKIIPGQVLLVTNWHNLDVSASILFLSLVCTTILISGVVSFTFYMLQINQIMKESIMNLQMVHSIENKDKNLEAFGEKEEKTMLLALEPLAEKMKGGKLEACGPKEEKNKLQALEPLAENEVVVFVEQEATSVKRNTEESIAMRNQENREIEEELKILDLIVAENHKLAKKLIENGKENSLITFNETDPYHYYQRSWDTFRCTSNKLLYEKLLELKKHNRKISKEVCCMEEQRDEQKEHSEKQAKEVIDLEAEISFSKNYLEQKEKEIITLKENIKKENLLIRELEKDLVERIEEDDLLDSKVTRMHNECALNMRQRLEKLRETLDNQEKRLENLTNDISNIKAKMMERQQQIENLLLEHKILKIGFEMVQRLPILTPLSSPSYKQMSYDDHPYLVLKTQKLTRQESLSKRREDLPQMMHVGYPGEKTIYKEIKKICPDAKPVMHLSSAEEEGLNIELKKELNEKKKLSDLLESQLAKIIKEYKLNMKEEIKKLTKEIKEQDKAIKILLSQLKKLEEKKEKINEELAHLEEERQKLVNKSREIHQKLHIVGLCIEENEKFEKYLTKENQMITEADRTLIEFESTSNEQLFDKFLKMKKRNQNLVKELNFIEETLTLDEVKTTENAAAINELEKEISFHQDNLEMMELNVKSLTETINEERKRTKPV